MYTLSLFAREGATAQRLTIARHQIVVGETPEQQMYCTQPWTTFFVAWDGTVRTCCFNEYALGTSTLLRPRKSGGVRSIESFGRRWFPERSSPTAWTAWPANPSPTTCATSADCSSSEPLYLGSRAYCVRATAAGACGDDA